MTTTRLSTFPILALTTLLLLGTSTIAAQHGASQQASQVAASVSTDNDQTAASTANANQPSATDTVENPSALASSVSGNTPTKPAASKQHLTSDQIARDLSIARETYERLHPGYTRYAERRALDQAWDDILIAANNNDGMTRAQFYMHVSRVLTLIRCDHTKAELPNDLREERNEVPVYLPAKIDLIERRGFVSSAFSESGLKVNDEILAIDGRSFEELLLAVEPYVPFDGNTPWSRVSGLTVSLEFMGGALDHFGAFLFDIKEHADVTVKRQDKLSGGTHTLPISVPRTTHEQWSKLQSNRAALFDGIPATTAANFKDGVFVKVLNDSTAYLRVDTFVNYRQPVDPETVYAPVFEQLKKAGVTRLILDLRRNGGGSNDAMSGLFAHLTQEDAQVIKDMRVATLDLDGLRENLWTWDKRALNPNRLGFRKNDDGTFSMRSFVSTDLDVIKRRPNAFDGEIFALTSNANSSGTTNLLSVLKNTANVTLIGEKTGGSAEGPTAGLLFTLTLPESGIKTRVPFFRIYNNSGEVEPGLGLTPDVKASQTVKDYLSGKDTAFETAFDIANKRRNDGN